MRSWQNSPRYMRAMQKINRLRPEHAAILQTVTADPQFADEEMRKSIQSMVTKTGNVARQKNLGLRKTNQAHRELITGKRNAMAERDRDYNKGQGKKAFGLGIANLGLNAVGGVARRKKDKELADLIAAITRKYKGPQTGQESPNDSDWWGR